MIQTHFFQGGLDQDTELRFLASGDYLDAVNVRVLASQDGNTGSVENLKGNVLITNNFIPDSNFRCIGSHEDKQSQRIFFWLADLDKSRNLHGIFEYNQSKRSISKIFQSPRLNFHEHNLISSAVYTNNMLGWCNGTSVATEYVSGKNYNPGDKVFFEGNIFLAKVSTISEPDSIDWLPSINPNPPCMINIQQAREGMYDNIDFENNIDFDLIKIPSNMPPAFKLELEDGPNFMNQNSYQFASRFIYKDGQKSIFSMASELAVVAYASKQYNKITVGVSVPGTPNLFHVYRNLVTHVEFAFRDNYINPFRSIGILKFPTPVQAQGVNTEADISSISGKNVTGYFNSTKPGAALYKDPEGTQFIGIVDQVFNFNNLSLVDPAEDYTGLVYEINPIQVNGVNYYATIEFRNDESYAIIPDTITSIDYDRVPLLCNTMTFAEGRLFTGGNIEGRDAVIPNFNYGGLSTEALIPNRRIFKPGGKYKLGFEFKDYAHRRDFVFSNNVMKLNPISSDSATVFNGTINENSLPDWVDTYTPVVTENLNTEWFVQGRIEAAYYKIGETIEGLPIFAGSGNNVYNDAVTGEYNYIANENTPSVGGVGDSNEVYLDISNWLRYKTNIPYNFIDGDVVDILSSGGSGDVALNSSTYRDIKILRQEGQFLAVELPSKKYYGVSIYTDVQGGGKIVGENGLLYAVSQGFTVVNKVETGTTTTLRSVSEPIFNKSMVIVGDSGLVIYKRFANSDLKQYVLGSENLLSVKSLEGDQFIAVGENGTMYWILGGYDEMTRNKIQGIPATDQIISVGITRRIDISQEIEVTYVTKDGIYRKGLVNKNTFTFTQSHEINLNGKANKLTTFYQGILEYTWIAGSNADGSGKIWCIKDGEIINPAGTAFDDNPVEFTAIDFYNYGPNTNNYASLVAMDSSGQMYSRTLFGWSLGDFIDNQPNLEGQSTTTFYMKKRDISIGVKINDIDIVNAGGLNNGLMAGASGSGYALNNIFSPSDNTVISSFVLDKFINYKAKIEIRRPRKTTSETFFYESILSNKHVTKKTGATKLFQIGAVDEGDCFYIEKTFKGSRWNEVTDFVVSMTPDSGNTTGVTKAQSLGGWHKGNNRPNIVFSGVQKQQKKLTGMRFSNNYIADSPINGLCSFEEFNEKIFPIEYVALNKIGVVTDNQINGNVLLALFTLEATSIYINRVQYTDAQGRKQVALSDTVIGSSNTLKGGNGTINPESVVFQSSRAYWWDAINGTWCRYGNDGVTPISEVYKLRSRHKQLAKKIAKYHYNPLQIAPATYNIAAGEFIGSVNSFADNTQDTIGFNEDKNRFSARYELGENPEYYGKAGLAFVYFVDGQLWLDGENSLYNNFFGKQINSSITSVSNEEPVLIKSFRSLKVSSQDKWSIDLKTTIRSKDRGSYKSSISLGQLKDYSEDEACYTADVVRASNTATPYQAGDQRVNGYQMRGVYLISTLKLDPSVNYMSCLYCLSTEYNINSTSK